MTQAGHTSRSHRALAVISALIFMICGTMAVTAEQKPAKIGVLFVATADGFDHDGATLTLKDVAKNVVMFSDRPDRLAATITLGEFLGHWDEGADSYETDPPNVVLSVEGRMGEPVVMELSRPVTEGGKLRFTAKTLYGDLPETGGPISLVFDIR